MYFQFVASLACVASLAAAAPSLLGGAVVAGPAGIVTNHGAIGPAGHGLGLGLGGLGLAGLGGLGGLGLGHGAIVAGPAIAAAPLIAAPAAIGIGHAGIGLGLGGLGVAHGAAAITNGGGSIGASAHGATIAGPPTAPVVVAGPSGKIAADGLWGPTANIGLSHGGWGHW